MKGKLLATLIVVSGVSAPLLLHTLIQIDGKPPKAKIESIDVHEDIGEKKFPRYVYPQKNIVPWRTNSPRNFLDPEADEDQHYGTVGYLLFATHFSFPDANGGAAPNAEITELPSPQSPLGSRQFPTVSSLPPFIADWDVLCTRMAGGWAYALIDDPRLQNGERKHTFDGKHYPEPNSTNRTGVDPYLKIGILDGPDMKGDAPELGVQSDRWSFTIGPSVPTRFRVGVMTDGLDNPNVSPGQVFLRQIGGESSGSRILQPNRFVDLVFFDITGAKAGDIFVISAAPGPQPLGAGISGVTFDIVEP